VIQIRKKGEIISLYVSDLSQFTTRNIGNSREFPPGIFDVADSIPGGLVVDTRFVVFVFSIPPLTGGNRGMPPFNDRTPLI